MTIMETPPQRAVRDPEPTAGGVIDAGKPAARDVLLTELGLALSACGEPVETLHALLERVVPALAPSATVAWLDALGHVAHVAIRARLADDDAFTEVLPPSELPSVHYAMLHDALALPPAARPRGLPFEDGALRMLPLVQGGRLLGALWIDGEVSPLGVATLDDVADRAGVALATARMAGELRLESERRASAEAQLSESHRRKQEFLAMLSHELRNPLAPIRNAIEVIRLVAPPDPKLQWATEVTDRQVRTLSRLVDELLDAARLNEGKIALQKQSVDVVALVERCVEQQRAAIAARGQALAVAVPGFAVDLDGDPTRLAQVVDELLQNAIKYTPVGGSLSVSVQRDDHADGCEATIVVADDGIGIAPALMPHVFDLFEQGERALDRKQGGLGVGLTLVRRIVSLHGGSVEVDSAGPGQGARFTVRLPCLSEVVAAEGIAAAVDDAALAAMPRRRVLVVEDNADVAESTTMLLSLAGHEVRCAANGMEAMQIAVAFGPDVVLLDIGLPLMDGYEVARRLRSLPETQNATLIALTGYGLDADRRRGVEAGFDGHLVKPANPAALAALMAR